MAGGLPKYVPLRVNGHLDSGWELDFELLGKLKARFQGKVDY